jgi:hypothetical protein
MGILSNELRLGNYVYDDEFEISSIEQINSNKINQFTKVSKGNSEPYISNIYPIPLTEKLLVDLGLEPSAFTGLYYDKEGIIDIKVSWDHKFTVFYKNFEIREVKFVHDLQNLVFTLTK